MSNIHVQCDGVSNRRRQLRRTKVEEKLIETVLKTQSPLGLGRNRCLVSHRRCEYRRFYFSRLASDLLLLRSLVGLRMAAAHLPWRILWGLLQIHRRLKLEKRKNY